MHRELTMSQQPAEYTFNITRQPNGSFRAEYDVHNVWQDDQGRTNDFAERGTLQTDGGRPEAEERQALEEGIRGLVNDSKVFGSLPHPLTLKLRYHDGGGTEERILMVE